ncbi:hypothetical protein [Sulfidibacter corallicola]|uniref:Uncharacterized protein n=1 Tax=Sulfidibacter corallicola TaxID=2818388 RepID=A0A8A4TNN9_SULCO|nr:hypothetical protein [Sulfidibacter corallicola]QTD48205.1 hypothetical protein J3U87_21680 [Sulfidibacter corallicola]
MAADEDDRFFVLDGVTSLYFYPDVLTKLNIDIVLEEPTARALWEERGYRGFALLPEGDVSFLAPGGDFEGVAPSEMGGNSLVHDGGFVFEVGDVRVDLRRFTIQRAALPWEWALLDAQGRTWFRLRHAHSELKLDRKRLELRHMDLALGPAWDGILKDPHLREANVGAGDLILNLALPERIYQFRGLCEPNFEGEVDIHLTQLGTVTVFANLDGKVAMAPSATLENVGVADVPWLRSIVPDGGISDPSEAGQHPYLIMAFYRMVDGRIVQVGYSDVKHAFFAVNSGCSCPGGQVLYVGCSDIYGASTNANRTYLAPRDEVTASTGEWTSLGSHFDGDPVDDRRDHSSAGHDSFEHRLFVQESVLQREEARYFVDAWYVVQGDIDIFNSMAYREVNPTEGTNWSFPPVAGMINGTVVDAWVPAGTMDIDEANVVVDTGEGHLNLAGKMFEESASSFRYEYALMNHDFDRRIQSFTLPLPEDVVVTDSAFFDGDEDAANDWTVAVEKDRVVWTAPDGADLDWGTMINFSLTCNGPPGSLNLELGVLEPGESNTLQAAGVGPVIACQSMLSFRKTLPSWPDAVGLLGLIETLNALCR